MSRLKEKYQKEIISALMEKFGYKNPLAVPCLEKIAVNMGVGEASADIKFLDSSVGELKLITGQAPVKTHAKKSIAGFKLREGMAIGCRVTLRGERMYEFFDRLVNIALPRVRDFQGTKLTSFDGHGNYTLGITEQIIFPEINYDKVVKIRGFNITIVTSAKSDEEATELLSKLGMPFKDSSKDKEA
ncbi:50S ribosomal protein L5 [bacterium]|nr:50S ribosomal protein L5 [bacterium]MBU1614996.1 50S ribosomal protein L5 [bacterium]